MTKESTTLSQLESHLWEAANILRGPVDAADFKTYVFPLLFFKRISDVHDEEYTAALSESGGDEEYAVFPQNYRFQIPKSCHWDDVRVVTTNVGQALQKAMRGIEKANPETLYGIFGDAGWTNKDRLPDSLLRDLVEHFSRIDLGNQATETDVLGQSYEYLITKFADLTNKKAGEFYTPRPVVRLMVKILDPRERESIYDPACGTGGMLLETINHVRECHGDDRTLWGKLFAQEKNLTTSAIARMNLFLHGASDFQVVRGDTLRQPAFFSGDNLATFDCVIANPPFSLERWGDEVWTSDPYGRNFAGMPPANNGDYAWVQHMIKSMAARTGRMAVVLPHGALFRAGKEGGMRKKILHMDLLDAVIGLGPNLFYGAGLAACILVFRQRKVSARRKKVLIVDASREFKTGRAQNELLPEHVERIYSWYAAYKDVEGVARLVTLDHIAANDNNLNISRYVAPTGRPRSHYRRRGDEAAGGECAGSVRGGTEADRNSAAVRFYRMKIRILQQQLESYLWGAAVLLRGTIDAGDYKQFIFPLLFYKRICDVFDEETNAALKESNGDLDFASYPEHHRFQIPRDAHWLCTRQTTNNVGMAIQSAMRAIETANPETLYGIFGDAQWTNKDRLSDAMLRDLIEHFSTLDLSIANLPEDELGQGYEYLIKKLADDSGHTAAEFYTNRTVVHLMTEMLEPQQGESIYDPTCGSGGMLLSCIAHLRRLGLEWRNVRLFGQERNLMTSSIARMNFFLHGIEKFQIVRGDTLSDPKFVKGDRLKQFDLVLANPPYSIKQWDREAFASDPWGRNLYGTPPQGRADYAFWQHILCSLAPKTGRCAILFPHGVLFRQEESEMRRKLVEADLIECVLGLGPNLFYNSPMEACVVICRGSKPKAHKGKILLINAVSEVTRERAQSFLTDDHIEHIASAYRAFRDEPGFASVASIADIRSRNHSLAIPLYVEPISRNGDAETSFATSVTSALTAFLESRQQAEAALGNVLPGFARSNEAIRLAAALSCAILKDRGKWKRARFGDVVENVNETVKDPASAGLGRFIGMEHLEPGSLRVRTWGNVSDGTTFTRRCRPGQVLFGKRRAYQRKVAVADFDAVVSGDIYVLQKKNGQLLSDMLPFLCLSERFFRHAVGTSAGSLSPRTSWESLATFEFALPPLDRQRRIADVLSAVEDTEATLESAVKSAQGLRQTHLHAAFDGQNVGRNDQFARQAWSNSVDSEHRSTKAGPVQSRTCALPMFLTATSTTPTY